MEIEKKSNTEYNFIFLESSNTLGNLLQKELLKDSENVLFAGYSVPHPLEKRMFIRVITKEKSPREIMNNAFARLIITLNELYDNLEDIQTPQVLEKRNDHNDN